MSANGEPFDVEDAIEQLATIVAAFGAADIDEICAILAEKLGCTSGELKAGLMKDPLKGRETSYEDVIAEAIQGVSTSTGGSK